MSAWPYPPPKRGSLPISAQPRLSGWAETSCPVPIPGDFDGDLDVDQEDFGHFQVCLSGSVVTQTDPDCQDANLDDDDVDHDDFSIFQGCMTGANLVGDPSCAD